MKKNIFIIFLLQAISMAIMASNVFTGTVLLNGIGIKAEYTIKGDEAWLGSGRNACIPQYSAGKVEVPGTISKDGREYPVTRVSDMAFRLCTKITSVILPEGVTRVGNFAFNGCHDLTKVALPSTVTSIGTGAFIDLPNLSDFLVKATTPPKWEYNDVFFFHEGGIGGEAKSIGNIILYVPDDNFEDYRNALYSDDDFEVKIGWVIPDGWGSFTELRSADEFDAAPYAVYNYGTLTFYCDGKRDLRPGDKYDLNEGSDAPSWIQTHAADIKSVVFAPSFLEARPTSTAKWMTGCENLTSIRGWEYLNTSEVTDMTMMFWDCSSLTSVDLSHFDTQKCELFRGMFYGCSSLASIDVSSFDTSNAKYMNRMFQGCSSLKSLDLNNFDTREVYDFNDMFRDCSNLETLHIERFYCENGSNFFGMFQDCGKLKNVTVPSTVRQANYVLYGCKTMQDVYYYGLEPFEQWVDNTNMLAPNKATFFHVLASKVDAWTTVFPDANCTFVGDLGTEDNPFLLYTAADWTNLSNMVSQGVTNINAKMMADIPCDQDIFVGSAQHPFIGTFDGNGYTLTMNVPYNKSIEGLAPFSHIGNATIKNLVVGGEIVSGIYTAGVAGFVDDNATLLIENCRVNAYINASYNNNAGPHAGGFVGHGGNATITIKGCLFDGNLGQNFTSDDSYAAPFVGWCGSSANVTITDCFEDGIYNELYKHVGTSFRWNGTNTEAIVTENTYNRHEWNDSKHGHSITCGTEGLNVNFNYGTTTKTYDVSGIRACGTGIIVGDTYYASDNENVSFTIDNPGYYIGNLKVNDNITPNSQGGNLDGSDATYSFTINECVDYVITADMIFRYIVLNDNAIDNSKLLEEHVGETTNVQLKNRTIYLDGSWNTLCLPFDLTEEQVRSHLNEGYQLKLLESASFSNGILTLNFKDTTAVAAGKPFIIRWNNPLTVNEINPVYNNVTISTCHPRPVKLELGNSSMGIEFKGIFDRFDIEGEDRTMLYLGGDNLLYYPKAAMSVNAFRAYFELRGLTAGDPANGINSFVLNFGDKESAIFSIENGQLKVEKDAGAWYTIDGRILNGKPTQKGIYINNGQKVVVE